MKKKNKIYLWVSVVTVLCCFIAVFFNNSINECYKYTKEYLGCMPDNKLFIAGIEKSTDKYVDKKRFDDAVFFSKYLKRFLLDKFIFHLDDRMGDESIIESYHNEVVVLRLKTFLINGEERKFTELYCESFYSLDTCWIYPRFLTDLLKDKNYPVAFDDSQYQIIENTYKHMLVNTDDKLQKYFINESKIKFYSAFKETENEILECKELREKLIDELGSDKIKEEVLKRNGLNSFTDSLNMFKD